MGEACLLTCCLLLADPMLSSSFSSKPLQKNILDTLAGGSQTCADGGQRGYQVEAVYKLLETASYPSFSQEKSLKIVSSSYNQDFNTAFFFLIRMH